MLLVLLVALELTARWLSPRFSALPPQNVFSEHLADLQEANDSGRCYDLIFTGASAVQLGFDLAKIAEATNLSTYSAANPNVQMRYTQRWVREFVLPLGHPRYVVVPLSIDVFYDIDYLYTVTGERMNKDAFERLTGFEPRTGLVHRALGWSMLYTLAPRLRDPRSLWNALTDPGREVPESDYYDSFGAPSFLGTAQETPAPQVFNPSEANFKLNPTDEVPELIKAETKAIRQAGATPVFVELPLATSAIGVDATEILGQYQARLRSFLKDVKEPLYRLNVKQEQGRFVDLVHLGALGRSELTSDFLAKVGPQLTQRCEAS